MKTPLKIAITGTRGIPNRYGGFEQFAEKLSVGFAARGHDVWVYNTHFHPLNIQEYRGVGIISKRSPEKLLGSSANYLYDFICIRDAVRRKADIILECGFASAAPCYPIIDMQAARLVTHMDGMEWKRTKWGKQTRRIIRRSIIKAIRYSDAIVCDHLEILKFYATNYSVKPVYISYGAELMGATDKTVLEAFDLEAGNYYLIIARLEPENNIRSILSGYIAAGLDQPLMVVGDHQGKYGRQILQEFKDQNNILFAGGIYHGESLENLRHFSKALIQGHSVGGTNPSLLEAMAAGARIIAHDNPFNRAILEEDALYFKNGEDLSELLQDLDQSKASGRDMINNNRDKIRASYQWENIIRQYEELFLNLTGG
jgi:glycosyltransferase involved in cell wall biosynthesis